MPSWKVKFGRLKFGFDTRPETAGLRDRLVFRVDMRLLDLDKGSRDDEAGWLHASALSLNGHG